MTKGMSYRGHKYNGAIDEIDVQPGVVYEVARQSEPENKLGQMFQHDIFNPIPVCFYDADYVFVDPPYNLGMVKQFYHKAEMEYDRGGFEEFVYRMFSVIRDLHAHGNLRSAFVEIGKQGINTVEGNLSGIFDNVRTYESYYYGNRSNYCYIVQGWDEGYGTDIPDENKDEMKLIGDIVRLNPGKTVLDFFGGIGGTSNAAFKCGNPFIFSELNRNRLAVAIKAIRDKGGIVTTRAV